MTTAPSPTTEKPPKLRWYQWRLRSLFILILVVAIGMSWLTVTIRGQRRQKAAAEEIERVGGRVTSEPTWLGKLLRDDSLVNVTDVTFPGYAIDRQFDFQDRVTDAWLQHLEVLNQLQTLVLFNAHQITDAGLVHLRGLRQLQVLELGDTKVGNAGLVHLRALRQLQDLDLSCTMVTDAGLVHLQGLSRLRTLDFSGTQVTDEGVTKLQQELPNCRIKR